MSSENIAGIKMIISLFIFFLVIGIILTFIYWAFKYIQEIFTENNPTDSPLFKHIVAPVIVNITISFLAYISTGEIIVASGFMLIGSFITFNFINE